MDWGCYLGLRRAGSEAFTWATSNRAKKACVVTGAFIGFIGTILLIILDPPHQADSISVTVSLLVMLILVPWLCASAAGMIVSCCVERSPYNVVILIGASLLFLTIALFTNGLLCVIGVNPWTTPSTEMPLGSVESIAVDDQGRIYLALGFYNRVQQYDPDGHFLRGWFIHAGKPGMSINIVDNTIEVYARSLGVVYIYDAEGELLAQRDVDSLPTRLPGLEAIDTQGNRYVMRWRSVYPSVKRFDPTGKESTIISIPWYVWCWMGPFPAIGYAAIGVPILFWANRKTKQ